MTDTKKADLLHSKQHFHILDGMRGIAAISVVTFHFMEMTTSDYSKNFIGHGFLAVDFFFCLSGFVIGYAYDDRLGKMGVVEFFKSRLIRLHPLVVFGTLLGLLTFLLVPFPATLSAYPFSRLLPFVIAGLLMVPYPYMIERGNNLFNINPPAWSLFWEYVANIVYALVLRRLHYRWLMMIAVLAAGGICYITYKDGNIMGGWSGGTFWDGGVRIAYSFAAGLLVYRMKWIIRSNAGFGVMALLVLAAVLSPFSKYNWLTEPFIIIIYFPFIIALGAGAKLRPSVEKLCKFSGNLSYPLYMTHYAFLWMFYDYIDKHKLSGGQLALIIAPSVIVLIGFAYLVMNFYDGPVRKYFTERRKRVKSTMGAD